MNEYANKDYNLKYAVADVKEFASVFSDQQLKLQNYAALKTTYLLNSDATEANILASLERLAGASADKLMPGQQKLFADLAPAQPEDGVFIYYAGHGYAHGHRFYLLPHDMVMPERGEDFAKPEGKQLSSNREHGEAQRGEFARRLRLRLESRMISSIPNVLMETMETVPKMGLPQIPLMLRRGAPSRRSSAFITPDVLLTVTLWNRY